MADFQPCYTCDRHCYPFSDSLVPKPFCLHTFTCDFFFFTSLVNLVMHVVMMSHGCGLNVHGCGLRIDTHHSTTHGLLVQHYPWSFCPVGISSFACGSLTSVHGHYQRLVRSSQVGKLIDERCGWIGLIKL